MSVSTEVLFGRPQQEIASMISDRMSRASAVSIVAGFATRGGLQALSGPLKIRPGALSTLVVGAATYPAFETMDDLLAMGVDPLSLFVPLGHTAPSGTYKNPFRRFHPMLHSKVYHMQLADGRDCAFIGSHNITAFALTGLNGEASIYIEGESDSAEFAAVREHITSARTQAVPYMPTMKEAYAWWYREFLEGVKAEVRLPKEWQVVRTILVFAEAPKGTILKAGDQIYFEIPSGIEEIESLRTETHLFLFETLPADPTDALGDLSAAFAAYRCKTRGAENKQGNLEVTADWRIQGGSRTTIQSVPSGQLRPGTQGGWQQVRAEVDSTSLEPLDYLFDRDRRAWDPKFDRAHRLHPGTEVGDDLIRHEALPGTSAKDGWQLVTGLEPRTSGYGERDASALRLASPESGAFVLVSLRRRKKRPDDEDKG